MFVPSRHRAACLGLAFVAGALAGCSLNPQPLPPGEQPDGAMSVGTVQDAGASFGADGPGGGTGVEGGAEDANPASAPDAASDAGDAGEITDAPVAPADAAEGGAVSDALLDGPDEGE